MNAFERFKENAVSDYMDHRRFSEVKKTIEEEIAVRRGSNPYEAGGIGTLSEKTVHAVLKNYIEPDRDCHEVALDGFFADTHKADRFCDPFKDGWTGSAKGASVTFEAEGSILMLQWRRTVKQPAPVAYATIDGDSANRVKLDANFDETWGDLCCLTTLTESAAKGAKHTIKVEIAEEGSANDFMVISLIAADN